MLRLQQLKLPITHTENDLEEKIIKTLKIQKQDLLSYTIRKKSLDARKKPDLYFVYTIDVQTKNNCKILKKVHNKNIMLTKDNKFTYLSVGSNKPNLPPVIVGSGPAGLFCGYYLVKAGIKPIIIERGEDVDTRLHTVEQFWNGGFLNKESNVQFGEGGAGTFSDGKLNTLVKDPVGRNHEVLRIFVEAGAPNEILYEQKPHLGTDALVDIVKNIRNTIVNAGGKVLFSSKLTDFEIDNNQLKAIIINNSHRIETDTLVLAVGHSARDTFTMLKKKGISMEAKSFAVGLRAEHPQWMINEYQYGQDIFENLGSATYKLTHKGENGRGVYSFCMCPGGFVVNASSEDKRLAINGMSYQKRDSKNANSALIVTVTPDDFHSDDVLAGVEFQRELEEKAYQIGNGCIPVTRYEDFCKNQTTKSLSTITPCMKGSYALANLRGLLPETLNKTLIEGIEAFNKIIPGFSRPDFLLSGVESRTSSPIRITRDEEFQCSIKGIYPCGEGAGYAGGITSAAMDGLKVAEEITKKFIKFS